MQRFDVAFVSEGITCRAWHYRPDTGNGAAIVMAHGLGGTRECSLDRYAQRFAAAGYQVLVFDYRYFGGSDGEPRHLIVPRRQLQDWAAAIQFARGLDGVDPARIALWGSSYSGGHVMVAAAQDGGIAAVSAQCPMLDGMAATRQLIAYAGLPYALRLLGAGLRDLFAALGGGAYRIPLVAPPGQVAFMSAPDAEPGYRALAPSDWRNEACARLTLTGGNYRPIQYARRLPCPALIFACEQDTVAPASAAYEFARLAGDKIELLRWPIGHFDIYQEPHFGAAVARQLQFFGARLAG